MENPGGDFSSLMIWPLFVSVTQEWSMSYQVPCPTQTSVMLTILRYCQRSIKFPKLLMSPNLLKFILNKNYVSFCRRICLQMTLAITVILFGLGVYQLQPEVPQSPDARLSWAFVVRGFISMINIAKMQEKIQRDWNSKTLTFALTFCMRTPTPTRTRTPTWTRGV